ncbi:DUF6232 family protein [Komagataeibacter xylinus]|uniref:DUF6232 family protein n=1 Tax=Komagataeibacter xylinus TaxID=28448 RepID=UPI000AEA7406|nr:DUF6232 family protein [Komagataeibacter xylinus]GBQ80529.1 hypothetical protein AA15237_3006 [Komagataeibacter xylinus NBRC 15237]
MNNNEVIFKQNDISVDQSLIKIGNASYSVGSIGSTIINKEIDPVQVFLAICGIVIIFIGLGFYVIPGLIFIFIWYKLAKKAPWYKYTVLIKNSSGDHPALQTSDQTYAVQLHHAIEQAISLR